MSSATWLKDLVIFDFYPQTIDWRRPYPLSEVFQQYAEAGVNAARLDIFDFVSRCYFNSRLFPKHDDLGERDLLAEMLAECRKWDMKSIVYMHVGCVGERFYQSHRDWVALDVSGNPKSSGWGGPQGEKDYHLCLLSGYREFVLELVKELVEDYPSDALYVDGPSYLEQCYCPRCREDFKRKTGHEIPRYWPPKSEDFDEPRWRSLLRWRYEHPKELLKAIRDKAKSIRDIPLLFNLARYSLSAGRYVAHADEMADLVDGINVESYVTSSGASLLEISRRVKFVQAMGAVPISWIENLVFGWAAPQIPAAELKLKIALVVANGGRPMLWPGNLSNIDGASLPLIKPLIRELRDRSDYFRECEPVKYCGVLFSRKTDEYYGRDSFVERYEDSFDGFCHLLIDAQVPFRVLLDRDLRLEKLRGYKIVVLSNVACLTDDEIECIHRYVAQGGNVIATYETSRCDEEGRIREKLGIGRFLDCTILSQVGFNSHYSLPKDHVLALDIPFASLSYPDLILFPTARHLLVSRPAKGSIGTVYEAARAQMGLKLGTATDSPALIHRGHGKGHMVYLPSDIGYLYFHHGFESLRLLARNIVNSLSPPPIATNAPKIVSVFHATGGDKSVVTLVNLASDAKHRTDPITQVIALRDIVVRIRAQEPPAMAMINSEEAGFSWENGTVSVRIPELREYAFIYLRYRS